MRGIGNRVKKKSNPPDDRGQSQRFMDTARQLDADETGKSFDKALCAIVAPKKKRTRSK